MYINSIDSYLKSSLEKIFNLRLTDLQWLQFNVETLQAFGTLFQIPHYYRKFLYCKTNFCHFKKKFVSHTLLSL
jgi:hypothetical protein